MYDSTHLVSRNNFFPQAKISHQGARMGWHQLEGCNFHLYFRRKDECPLYTYILDSSLIPFIALIRYPDQHRFMQDNDPKHTSKHASEFLQARGVNWWKTPPESPDCNPIENLWHELKEYIRREIKPKTKQELTDGIQTFWRTVTIAKCQKYIGHLWKVLMGQQPAIDSLSTIIRILCSVLTVHAIHYTLFSQHCMYCIVE